MIESIVSFLGFQEADEMDEQTRMAHFESMRRAPLFTKRKCSRNKKLFVIHKDLQKQCDKEVRRHAFDARVATSEINRQQQLYQRKQETLRKQKKQAREDEKRTHDELDQITQGHKMAELTLVNLKRPIKTSNAAILKQAIAKLDMPRHMKEKLKMDTYTTWITLDL